MAPFTKRKVSETEDDVTTVRHKAHRPSSTPNTPPPTGHRLRTAASTSKPTCKHHKVLDDLTSSPTTTRAHQRQTPKKTRKSRIASDPINISIYELRKEGLDWDVIATRTNKACNIDKDKELTGPACYSRFRRNGPIVAEAKGEPYQKEWYLHMSGKVTFVKPEENKETEVEEHEEEAWQGSETLEAEIVKTVEHERAQFWANVTEVVNAKLDGHVVTEEEVKALYDRVTGVEA